MRYEFHPDALVELEQTARYYGAREAGLDGRFVDSVEETIGRRWLNVLSQLYGGSH